ncbi:MAG: pyridoxamine 5'-phosphate oxidase family protein [Pseudomonadota bacterium]|nr:pyridoxamine 5'-phosphate oxidase family protein [Pseudomonadota bacterium]
MGSRCQALESKHRAFIEAQPVFFVATAAREGHINLSPKGLDSLRVLDEGRVAWLNLTGSGNETAAHLRESPRMTLMFCAFSGDPLILRVYGSAHAVHPVDPQWEDLIALFPPLPGARQVILLDIELVQTSCGFAVPVMEYAEQRAVLVDWARKKGEAGIRRYWAEKNAVSLDGLPTGLPVQSQEDSGP